jgi:predicted ATP-dependent endonuclease of OLD family
MHLQSIRIVNYRSFQDSGPITFKPGFNLIVGANNVGKSSLLHCLAGKLSGEPHRSMYVLRERDDPVNRISKIEFAVVASGDEVRRLLINHCNGQRFFP